jgi:hypothetical protein
MRRPTHRWVAGIHATALLFAALEAWAADENAPASKAPKSPQQAKLVIARQQIDAEVGKVDQRRNTVTVTTEAGRVQLQARPPVLGAFKKGDRVVLK